MKQKADGKYEQHKQNCRRQGRKRDVSIVIELHGEIKRRSFFVLF